MRVAPELDRLIKKLKGGASRRRTGARSLSDPFARIVAKAPAIVQPPSQGCEASNGDGLDARSGEIVDMVQAGIIDP